MVIWVCRTRRKQFLALVAVVLGAAAGEYAEDVFSDFCVKRLRKVLLAYKSKFGLPIRGWIELCLYRYSKKENKRIHTMQATTVSLDALRDGSLPESSLLDRLKAPGPGPEDLLLYKEFKQEFRAAYKKLPSAQRRSFRKSFQGMAHAAIAKKDGLSTSSVRSNVLRARAKIRRDLGGGLC